jgi:hypothetical protein
MKPELTALYIQVVDCKILTFLGPCWWLRSEVGIYVDAHWLCLLLKFNLWRSYLENILQGESRGSRTSNEASIVPFACHLHAEAPTSVFACVRLMCRFWSFREDLGDSELSRSWQTSEELLWNPRQQGGLTCHAFVGSKITTIWRETW